MATMTWTNFNNGETNLNIRTALNAFNTAVRDQVNLNTAGISTNATNISTNTTNIATNTTNIATNTADIAAIDTRVTAIEAGHTLLVEGISTVAQNPTGLGDANKVQVVFDAADTSPDVEIATSGAITFNTTGKYLMRFEAHYGRTGATGASLLVFRYKINGTPAGTMHMAKLDNADIVMPWADTNIMSMTAGDIITMEILRDSSGNDSGGLVTATTDWGTVPSCRLVVYNVI